MNVLPKFIKMRDQLEGDFPKYSGNSFRETFNLREQTIEAMDKVCQMSDESERVNYNAVAASSGSGKTHFLLHIKQVINHFKNNPKDPFYIYDKNG